MAQGMCQVSDLWRDEGERGGRERGAIDQGAALLQVAAVK